MSFSFSKRLSCFYKIDMFHVASTMYDVRGSCNVRILYNMLLRKGRLGSGAYTGICPEGILNFCSKGWGGEGSVPVGA